MTGGLSGEHELASHHQLERVCWNPSWLSIAWATRKDPDWSETTQKLLPSPLNLGLWALLQSTPPGLPYLAALCLGASSPYRSVALLAYVSPWAVPCWVLDKSPLSRSWKGSPFLQQNLRGAHIVTLHGAATKQASHVLLVKRQRKSLLPRISTFWSREMYLEELYADRRQCICLFCIGLIRRLTVGGQVQTKKHQT